MSKRFVSKAAKCPYYKSQNRSVVICHGPCEGTSLHFAFDSPAARLQYQKEVCHTYNYADKCIIAKVHEEKWKH